ncbi:hypothetical protein MHBO_000799 [Bonamia ostreae]|uniref:Uncharacterized protein n=1 Tax=Bonamia ostreae TaxID=126728 RepID=A0ABV2AGU6_9EUKA
MDSTIEGATIAIIGIQSTTTVLAVFLIGSLYMSCKNKSKDVGASLENLGFKHKMLAFIIGMSQIVSLMTILGMARNWIHFFSEWEYTSFNLYSTIPGIFIPLFVPILVKRFQYSTLFYIAQIASIFADFMLVFAIYISIHDISEGLTIMMFILVSTGLSLSQTVSFSFLNEIDSRLLPFMIAGLPTATMVSNLFILFIEFLSLSIVNTQLYFFFPAIFLHFLGIAAFAYMYENYYHLPVETNSQSSEDENSYERTPLLGDTSSRKSCDCQNARFVCREKGCLLFNNLMLFTQTFLIFPAIVFLMVSSFKPLEKYWGTIISMLAGSSELVARMTNAVGKSCLTGKKTTLRCSYARMCLVNIPIIFFFAYKKYFYIPGPVIDISNIFLYVYAFFTMGAMF